MGSDKFLYKKLCNKITSSLGYMENINAKFITTEWFSTGMFHTSNCAELKVE